MTKKIRLMDDEATTELLLMQYPEVSPQANLQTI